MSFAKDENGDGVVAGGEILEGILKGIVNAVKNIGTWLKENVWTPFVDGLKSVFGIHSPATTMEPYGKDIGDGILNGIKSVFTNIKNWIQTNVLDKIQSAIDKGKEIIVNIKTKISEWKDSFNSWLDDLKGNNESTTFNVTAVVNNLVDQIPVAKKKIADMVANIKDKVDNIPVVKKTIDNMKSVFTTIKDSIPTGQKVIDTMKSKFTTIQDSIPTGQKVIDTMKSKFTTIQDSIPQSSKVIGSVKATLTSWENKLSNVWTNTKATLNTWENKLSNVWSNAKASFNTWVNNLGTPSMNSKANFTTYSDSISGYPSLSSKANFVTYSDSISGYPALSSSAKFITYTDSISGYPSISSKANFTDWADGIYGTPSVNSTANFTDWTDGIYGTPTIDVTANVTDIVSSGASMNYWKAAGGVLSHGVWSNIPQYASGTTRAHGSMFVAGEAGPEVVGHIGGRTEVLNKSQLASAMYSSVVAAMSQSLSSLAFRLTQPTASMYNDGGMDEDSMYRAFLRALNDSDSETVIELDGDVVYQKMVQKNRQNTRRTGVNAMAAG